MRKKLSHTQPKNKSQGFFTFAQNNQTSDYVRMAYTLALSLKHSQSKVKNLSIGITPGTTVPAEYKWAFDKIIEIPWKDDAKKADWKLQNEWKSIWMSPYDETIKLDCDMLFLSDIASWWDNLSNQPLDIVFTNTVKNWRGEAVTSDYYRKTFTKNKLPNIYTGLFYFRKTPFTYDLFLLTKIIFRNYEKFFEEFLNYEYRPTIPSTDVIFALAMKIMDDNHTAYTPIDYPTFTHMKTMIQGWTDENLSNDWTNHIKVFFNEQGVCKIGNHRQIYPLHYHLKDFVTDDLISMYEKLVKNV